MLTEICAEIRNYFLRDRQEDVHTGDFTVQVDGSIEPVSFLQDGQYFRIVGSVFNDGVHKYGENDLKPENEFSGAVWAMSVPPDVIALDEEITAWIVANTNALNSPYQSESFGGYSYSKGIGGNNSNRSAAYTWQDHFANRLSPYRRVSVL